MPAKSPDSLLENRLVAALPAPDRNALLDAATEVTLERGDAVFHANDPIRHVYFPRTGILSMVIDMANGGTVEVGTIGSEGFAGLPILHASERSPMRVYCQVPPCVCRKIPTKQFEEQLRRSPALLSLTHRYAQAHLNLAAQSIACNSLHPVEERLSRWLLMTQDRLQSDDLNMTQEILSEMLGVRRATVTTAAGALQKAGIIEYRRGKIRVLDRVALEESACECYTVVRDEFQRLLGGNSGR